MKIEYVDYGIANKYKDTIEINENLKAYPTLYKSILGHEMDHTEEFFTTHDLMIDLSPKGVSNKEMLIFMVQNPKSLIQFLPFFHHKRYGWTYDLNLCLTYGLMTLISGVFIVAAIMFI